MTDGPKSENGQATALELVYWAEERTGENSLGPRTGRLVNRASGPPLAVESPIGFWIHNCTFVRVETTSNGGASGPLGSSRAPLRHNPVVLKQMFYVFLGSGSPGGPGVGLDGRFACEIEGLGPVPARIPRGNMYINIDICIYD